MAAARRGWTRDELLVALNVYHKLTFGQFHGRQPVVMAVAQRMGRTSNSVAMKLCNLASLDPALKLRGIAGLPGASALDRAMWQEFHANLREMAPSSEEALRTLFAAGPADSVTVEPKKGVTVCKTAPLGPTETITTVKVRRGQEYFRDVVLNNFGGRCGVTGIELPELLIASHILPWGTHPEHRLEVQNGLCLSRLHDAAFDRGLIAFDGELRLVLSTELKNHLPQPALEQNFAQFEGVPLVVPTDGVLPSEAYLTMHRKSIFRNS